jgi:GH15 family glucan-1,4-alpha-glucosidase
VVVEPSQPLVMVLAAREVTAPLTAHGFATLDATTQWWHRWIEGCTLPQTHREAVARSALTVKLLQHQPTNALVAAPTTSLPERVGAGRNWDYRYTWLRDSSLMLLALQQLGHHDEAMAYWNWLAGVADRHGDDLSIAYTLDGDPVPDEQELVHLPGYRHSRPVRAGNGAAGQRQHDVYGHVMAAASHCYHHMDMARAEPPAVLARIADLAAQRWNRPDDSIWEVRDRRGHHVYSRMMCWLALDRAVDLAGHHALHGDATAWAAQRDAVRRQVLDRGWNPTVGAFTDTIDGDDIDAATLVAPLIGFLPPEDPRCRATRQTVTDRLSDHGLLHRYRHDDGLGGPGGAFLLCTLWLADTHTVDDDPERGEELLDRVLKTGNDLGLLAEQADACTRDPVGNFPQGLTHLGVIQSAIRLDAAR